VRVAGSWVAAIGRLLGLPKPAWNSVLPEYDPFKYNSFAVNAGNAEYRKALLHAKAEPYELNKQAQQQEALNKFRASSG